MIVFDIDGTLSIVGDRLKYIQGDKKDWDKFYAACGEDKPNRKIAEIHDSIVLADINEVIYVTGRRESCRDTTLEWLRLKLEGNIYSRQLFMRADGDFRHDTEVKPELIQNMINSGIIDMVFEDRASMVKKWRSLGITCLQVAEGDF